MLKGHEGPVHSAVFSPDGSRIVTASHDGTAWLWDAAGKELGVLKGHEDSVNSAAFSPDGSRIVTVSSDSTARLWSLRSLNADFATDLDIACNFALLKGSAFTGGEVKSLGALLDLPWDRDPCRPYSIAGKFWAQLTGTVPDTPAPPAATPTAETQP